MNETAKFELRNFLVINGKRIDLTEEQISSIKQSFDIGDMVLSSVKAADTFRIGEYEFFVLEQLGDRTVVLLKDLLHESEEFGSNNNYDSSNADRLCCEFGDKISQLVGVDNLLEHTVDLTADDGLKCYGSIQRKMSLLTAQLYRKYVYTIDKYKLDKYWWLATAFSTPKHDGETWVKCVSPLGDVSSNDRNDSRGVRPFCILKSDIFVSCEE